MNHNTLRKYLGKKVQHKSGYTMFVVMYDVVTYSGKCIPQEYNLYVSETLYKSETICWDMEQTSHKISADKFLSEWSLVEE